ncbi:diacylglycerol kinase family protein [Streptomyces sp. NPDC048282]|uniref:diacylglycerol kinase family protein n=1 Tax=Streptomyces sp. NPDC048282 TaxID=3365528 RepID=UPI003718894B
MATFATSDQLLVIIDPAARETDGESVRIAKDVLSAGAATKVCMPDGPEEFARVLARRGSRRPVVVGDDGALVRAVTLLHRQRELAGCVLSMVPVGGTLGVAHALGVPAGAVAAARAVLDGVERRRDLLVDDSDGVVLGALRIPPVAALAEAPEAVAARGWLRPYQHLVRSLAARPAPVVPRPGPARLRIEVDGETVVDLDQPVEGVSVTPGGRDGLAEVEVRPLSVGAEATPVRAAGRTVTVAGADFRYRADVTVAGPVRRRTWRVVEGAWGLTVPPS